MTRTAETPLVQVSSGDRRALRLPWSALIRNKAHEFWVKGTGRRIKGQGMIGADAARVGEGFSALKDDDFTNYNLPQAWVERRQIPRAIHQRVPRTNARIIDLGCGPGTSTEVLCHFADPSWTIIGFDLIDHYIAKARSRADRGEFRNARGQTIQPRFVCQSIAEPLRLDNAPLPDASFDLAISGGVVGLYLLEPHARRLLAELHRVVKPGGFIALDAGPSIPPDRLESLAREFNLSLVALAKSFFVEPRPKLIFHHP